MGLMISEGLILAIAIVIILVLAIYSNRKESYYACRPNRYDGLSTPLKDLTVLNPYIYPYDATWKLGTGGGTAVKLASPNDRSSSYQTFGTYSAAAALDKVPNVYKDDLILPGYPLTLNDEGFTTKCGPCGQNPPKYNEYSPYSQGMPYNSIPNDIGTVVDKPQDNPETFILMPNSPVYQLSPNYNGQCTKVCGMKYDPVTGTCDPIDNSSEKTNLPTMPKMPDNHSSWDRVLSRGGRPAQGRVSIYAEPDHSVGAV